jgi:hypothetical protein
MTDSTGEVCITCSDEGRVGEVVTPPATPLDMALVRTVSREGVAGQEPVDVTLVAPVAAGDLVLIHAGVALTRLESRP